MATNSNAMYSTKFSDKIFSVVVGKCPRCDKGNMFESNSPLHPVKYLNVNNRCATCDLNFKPELGFYWGATYVSYMLTVAFSVAVFVAFVVFVGFYNALSYTYLGINTALLVLLAPVFVRLSRAMWLWWFYEDKA